MNVETCACSRTREAATPILASPRAGGPHAVSISDAVALALS